MVPGRFNGPPGSGNGGYTCGLVAAATGLARPEVTLRKPPPLDVPLRVAGTEVYDRDQLVATAQEAAGDLPEPPPYPGHDAARAAQERYAGHAEHPFPTCYTCGPRRPDHDGLAIFAGPVPGTDYVAATWTPPAGLTRETVWAALDCPGAWGLMQSVPAPIVLGRLAVTIDRLPEPGEPHVVTGWSAAPSEGRKHYAGTALYDATGTVIARGRATWVSLNEG